MRKHFSLKAEIMGIFGLPEFFTTWFLSVLPWPLPQNSSGPGSSADGGAWRTSWCLEGEVGNQTTTVWFKENLLALMNAYRDKEKMTQISQTDTNSQTFCKNLSVRSYRFILILLDCSCWLTERTSCWSLSSLTALASLRMSETRSCRGERVDTKKSWGRVWHWVTTASRR